jgi:putative component of membrane protein insertase Oxa1/YidC/SpoIIIJ protein YidD
MRPGPGEETPEERRRRREERERRREQRREAAEEAADGAAEILDAGSGIGLPTGLGGRGGGRGAGADGGVGGSGGSGVTGSGGGGGSGVTGSGGGGGSGVTGPGGGGGSGCGSRGGSGDGCNACDCSLPLLGLIRLSTLLLLAATVLPDLGGTTLARSLIGLYRRRLTRFTPRCPSTPSCSAYALAAVESRGVRTGLALAARRVRACGPARGGGQE